VGQFPENHGEDRWEEWAGFVLRALRLPAIFSVIFGLLLTFTHWLESQRQGESFEQFAWIIPPVAVMIAVPLLAPICLYWKAYLRLRWGEMVLGSALVSAVVIVSAEYMSSWSTHWAVDDGLMVWGVLGPTILVWLVLRARS